jgi:hypothetical protein
VTWLLAAAALPLGWGAVARCRRLIAADRARVRRTAEAADVFGRARTRWDRGTAALEEALAPLLEAPPATGFADAVIEQELLERALRAPDLVEEGER